jgi:PAS domain S-box-containing protein
MHKALKLLILEDSNKNSLPLISELKNVGLAFTRFKYDSEKQLCKKLIQKDWDVFIVDCSFPESNGFDVLKIIKELTLNSPCIIVSTSVKEETIVELIKAGAFDYVNKNRLERLVPSVNRAVEESRTKKNRQHVKQEKVKFESDALVRALFEKNQAAILLLDVEQKNLPIVDANEAAVEYYGYSKEEMLQKTIMDLNVLPSGEVRKKMVTAKKHNQTIVEFQHRLSSGEIRDIESYSGPIDVYGRELVYIVVHDITNRKKTQEALRQSEERYKETSLLLETLFNTIPDVIGIQDARHRVLRYNEAGYKLLNVTQANIVGKKCFELIGNNKPCSICATTKVYETKKPEKIEKYVEELDLWLDVRAYPVLDEYGNIRTIIEHLRDITKRKKAERYLKESEQKYRNLAEKSPLPIIVHSQSKIEFANRAAVRLFGGKSKRDVIGKPFQNFVHPDYHIIVEKRVHTIYEKKGDAPLLDEKFIRLDGQVLNVEVAAAMINFKGKPASQVVFRDITYQKRFEMIQDLLYNISNAVHTAKDLNELFKVIRDELSQILDTNNFYIAIYDRVFEIVSLPIFAEESDNFKTFPKGKTLAAYVIEKNQPTLINKNEIDHLVEIGAVETFGSQSKIWLGVPLRAKNEIVGIIAVQSYTSQTAYGDEELEILKFASDQIGLSIERKLAEVEIKASLDEKIVLLKEIHHRVKNNLQVISSLLYLQSKNLADKDALTIFIESQNRVRSMALVHEKLYQSENLAKINLRLYISDLVRFLFRSYETDPNQIKMNLDVENISVDVESAIPCGLIINELVSNSLKYAFPNQGNGEITVRFKSKNKDQYRLSVSDNGIGLKGYLKTPNNKTLGLQLVDTLVDQLHGKVEINGKLGSEFNISFYKDKRKGKKEILKN